MKNWGRGINLNRSKVSFIRTMKGRCLSMGDGSRDYEEAERAWGFYRAEKGTFGVVNPICISVPLQSQSCKSQGRLICWLSYSEIPQFLTACRCYHFVNFPIRSFPAPLGFWRSWIPSFRLGEQLKWWGNVGPLTLISCCSLEVPCCRRAGEQSKVGMKDLGDFQRTSCLLKWWD